jgi:amino acid transporter
LVPLDPATGRWAAQHARTAPSTRTDPRDGGEIAGIAGYWAPLAFLLAASVAMLNGMASAELSTRLPRAGGPTAYVSTAFDLRWLSVSIGWAIIATGVVSAATITTGFAGYLSTFVDVPDPVVHTLLLTTLAIVAALGAKQSAWFMATTTGLGVLGLLVVIGAAIFNSEARPSRVLEAAPPLTDLPVLVGVASATFLAIYAFIGFEDMVHMAEEVRRPARNLPRAIAGAISIALVLYVLVAAAALSLATPTELESSPAPLVAAIEGARIPGWPVAILSVWIVLNGALAQIIMASRVLYDLGQRDAAPATLARVWSRTQTPVVGTLAAAGVALIRLERREPDAPFDTPV